MNYLWRKWFEIFCDKDNLLRLERIERERQESFEEERFIFSLNLQLIMHLIHSIHRRIFAQNEEQFLKETLKREQDNKLKIAKSSDGPAHKLVIVIMHWICYLYSNHSFVIQVGTIVVNRKKKEDDFYKSLMDKDDSLNKQLLLSEERGENRKKGFYWCIIFINIITVI